jgi:putative ABC transport system permease protein
MQIYRNSKVNLNFPTLSVIFGTIFISFFMIIMMLSERDLFFKLFIYLFLGIAVTILALIIILKLLAKINLENATLRLVLRDINTHKYFHIWQILGYSIVLITVLVMYVVSTQILPGWIRQIPVDAPNFFAINIPSNKEAEFKDFLKKNNMFPEKIYPLVRGRLVAVNGSFERNFVERPLNMTFSDEVPAGNEIISGAWSNGKKDYVSISIEKGFAERMKIDLGDNLTFAVQGEEFTGKVDSVRNVVWNEFKPNFFVIFPDSLKNDFSYTYMTSVFIPKESQAKIREMTELFPSVTLIDVEGIIWQISSIFSIIDRSLNYLWIIILLASALISYSYVLTSKDYKLFQIGLFRALGAKKSQIKNLLLGEFVVTSLLVSIIGLISSFLITYYIAEYVFNIIYDFEIFSFLVISLIFSIFIIAINLLFVQNISETKISEIIRK